MQIKKVKINKVIMKKSNFKNSKQVSLRSIIIVGGSGATFLCEQKIEVEDLIKQYQEMSQLCPDLFPLEYIEVLKNNYNYID